MTRFVLNPYFERLWLRSRDAERLKEEGAEDIAERAKHIAPVDTGAYRDSIHVENGQVVADVDHAGAVEWGTLRTPAFAPLRRGAEQVVGTRNVKGGDE